MGNKRVLVITNSVYQLFTAVHMKRALLKSCDVDLIVTDVTPQLKETIPRLVETGLFTRVIFGEVQALNRKIAAVKEEGFSEGFRNRDRLLRWVLNEKPAEYEEIYFANFDPFLRMLAGLYYDSPCECIWYEDGFSSYVIDYLREDRALINRHPEGIKIREKVKSVLLYEPRLAMRGDCLPNLALPKVRREDKELKNLLNHIFAYEPLENRGDFADFIFLEQSFRAEGLKTNDMELMEECRKVVGSGRFIVKPHPRNPENLPFLLGLTRRYPSSVPWELFLMNEEVENKAVITVCSNAALAGRLIFGMDMDTVMLYRLFRGKVLWKEDGILKRYLEKFHRQFAGEKYYVPQTVYELRSTLRYLMGQML